MRDDIVMDEKQIKVHHVGPIGRLRVKIAEFSQKWGELDKGQQLAIFIGCLVLMLVFGGGAAAAVYVARQGTPASTPEPTASASLSGSPVRNITVKDPEEPKDQISPLTGERLTQSQYAKLMERLPLAVVIENHPDARPQSGLDKADLVFETLAEGGITRFVGVFLTNEPEVVGPVRSVRKYFLDLIGFLDDPLIMHIGGAQSTNPEADALGEIQKQGVKSLGVSGGKFWRVTDRVAPHNAYASTKDLWSVAANIGWKGPSSVQVWQYKDEKLTPTPTATPLVPRVQVNWGSTGSNNFSTIWEYDNDKSVYKRSFNDGIHKDAITGNQLTAHNVVILYAPMSSAGDGSARITFKVIGKGKSLVLQDGKVINATYEKLTRKGGFNLKDQSGEAIKMNRGNTWVLLVPDIAEVKY